jgi:pimeloyl-ACP methyl ester carboxylesterase
MQRREALNILAVPGATVPAAMLSEAAALPSRATTSATRTTIAPFVEAHDGTRLYCAQWGSGRPILFLNSFGLTTQMWDYQMVAFADQGYRSITFDRRGHGRSDLALGGYDYDTFADDVAAVISALDLQDLTMVGHSMASGEIVRYLTRHGSARVARIVLLGPTTPYLTQTADNPNGVPQSTFEALRVGVVHEPSTSRAEKLSDAAAGWVYRRALSHRRRHRTIARFYETVFGGRILSRGDSSGAPGYIQIANTWLIVNVGGGPTPDKPSVTLSVPADPDSVSSFMNIRVADIQACYELWRSREPSSSQSQRTSTARRAATFAIPTATL